MLFSLFGFLAAALCGSAAPASAQQPAPGLRIYSQLGGTETYLIDTQGQTVHTWSSDLLSGTATYLDAAGSLYRAVRTIDSPLNGDGGRVQRVDLDGNVEWDFFYNTDGNLAHHDIEIMPNGNVLMLAWEDKSLVQAFGAGRNPALLSGNVFRPDHIIEVRPTGPTSGDIVWQWHVWDHLIQDYNPGVANYGVVADHPELIDVNYPPVAPPEGDWNHMNSIDYDPVHDWIMVSVRENNEVWIIDHGTTTEEAAGHTGGNYGKGGDLLYRWGNPLAYGRGGPSDLQIFAQHSANFIPPGYPGAGHVILFSNWESNPGNSEVVEFVLPLDAKDNFMMPASGVFGPSQPLWSYSSPGLGSDFVSSAERLPNGHTLICSGIQGLLLELDVNSQVVWSYDAGEVVFHTHYVERSAWTNQPALSISDGGTQEFRLFAGSELGGNYYLCLASVSGISPGFMTQGVHVPLNVDGYTIGLFDTPNAPPYSTNVGMMDALGRATTTFTLPPSVLPPILIGLEFSHTFVWWNDQASAIDGASNGLRFWLVE